MTEQTDLSGAALLDAIEITVRFGGMVAVDAVSLRINEGDRVGLIGPNGAGKSTLVNAITGEVTPARGTLRFRGRAIDRRAAWQRARMGLLRTRQELGLFRTMSVFENVLCGADNPGRRIDARQARVWVDEVVTAVGLGEYRSAPVAVLPYGLRKLVELARAIAARPAVLLLDEPVAGLNTAEKRAMVDTLQAIAERYVPGMLLIEHDMATVAALCPARVYALVAGRTVAHGSFADVVAEPEVIAAYLGRPGTDGGRSDAAQRGPGTDDDI